MALMTVADEEYYGEKRVAVQNLMQSVGWIVAVVEHKDRLVELDGESAVVQIGYFHSYMQV